MQYQLCTTHQVLEQLSSRMWTTPLIHIQIIRTEEGLTKRLGATLLRKTRACMYVLHMSLDLTRARPIKA